METLLQYSDTGKDRLGNIPLDIQKVKVNFVPISRKEMNAIYTSRKISGLV